MKETELKPCPFCGGKAELDVGKIRFYDEIFPTNYQLRVSVKIQCTKCHFSEGEYTACIDIDPETAQTKNTLSETLAVKKITKRWNRRADDEQRDAD